MLHLQYWYQAAAKKVLRSIGYSSIKCEQCFSGQHRFPGRTDSVGMLITRINGRNHSTTIIRQYDNQQRRSGPAPVSVGCRISRKGFRLPHPLPQCRRLGFQCRSALLRLPSLLFQPGYVLQQGAARSVSFVLPVGNKKSSSKHSGRCIALIHHNATGVGHFFRLFTRALAIHDRAKNVMLTT